MSKRRTKNGWVLGAALAAAVALVAILLAVQPPWSALNGVVRAAALLGYLAVFLSILSSLYLRELVRFFGRPFVQIHHILALTGLGLLLVHPLGVVLSLGSARWLLPQFGSWVEFWRWGGPPALYLLLLAALAAWQRQALKGWRIVHYGTYAAFLLGTVHAIMLGSDVRSLVARVVVILLAVAAGWVLLRRHGPSLGRGKG